MYFIEGRIQRMVNDIQDLIYTRSVEIDNMQIRYGEIAKNIDIKDIADEWQNYIPGTPWANAASGVYAMFRTTVEIPEEFDSEKVVLFIRTNKNGWNALNPQMLIYINGKEYQGLDTNHMEVLLDNCAQKGKTYDIIINAFSGLKRNYNISDDGNEVKLFSEVRIINPMIEELYYNLAVPSRLVSQLPEGSMERINLVNILNNTINKLDLRIVYSADFYLSLKEANKYIKNELYSKSSGLEANVTCIGHTHIDVAWLWRYCHTREKTVRSFSTVLRLMEQYPEYSFMSSQPQLYEFIKEDHPEVYKEIIERVKEGRWEPEGGMWVEADTNIPSGESLVRQFLIGKRFFQEEFGVESKILWLPDVFGYSAALPQIMKKSGIDYFMSSKLKNNEFNKFPYHTFMWKGIDGTEVLSHITIYCPHFYNGLADQGDIFESWNRYENKELNNNVILPYGYGDGGGGPTKEMLETIRRYNNGLPGSPKARPGKAKEYFDKLKKDVENNEKLPRWVGELFYENHRGTYTSIAKNKKFNRMAECLYLTAEWAASFAGLLLGDAYPSGLLNAGWKIILLNQFHDVLPGSSIEEVYTDTDKLYDKVFVNGRLVLCNSINNITKSIMSDSNGLVVFNSLSWERKGLVEFEYSSDEEQIYLEGQDGKIYNSQLVSLKDKKYVAEVEKIASKGYSTFKIKSNIIKQNISENRLIVSRTLVENRFFRIMLDDHANFKSIFDKRVKRELLIPGKKGNHLQAFEDKPRREDNWNLDIYYSEKMWEINDVESLQVIESGPVRGVLRIARKYLNSRIEQDITIYDATPRIDFKTVVDWKEKDIVVKVAFPLDINSDKATYEIQYGSLERNTHWNTTWDIAKFEVCGQKWADISEGGYGVSLLNDCKYGYDIKDSQMRLTLLRSGTIPNYAADKEIHEFTYSLYPHICGWREGNTVQQAYNLNFPLVHRVINEQNGNLPACLSMIKVDKENVIIEVVKKAESSSEIIIRVYEAYNKREFVKVQIHAAINRVLECDLLERTLGDEYEIPHQADGFSFMIKPFEIKTFKIVI